MTVIQVAIPVLRGKRRFHVEKGKRWSVVEHLMLDAVVKQPASAAELAQRSHLPRRVVVEAFIRLMRVGWVELAPSAQGLIFLATEGGKAQIRSGILQAPTVTTPRWMSFLVDQVAGSVFRRTDIAVRHRNELSKIAETLVYLPKSPDHDREDLAELFAAMEGDDEVIVRVEASPERFVERFAVVSVVNDTVEGLPARANPELRDAIKTAAAEALKNRASSEVTRAAPADVAAEPEVKFKSTSALFEQNDLIIDAADHRTALEQALRQAREQVVIHSTFVSEQSIPRIMPLLVSAAAKGTLVRILWGQDDDKTSVSTSRRAVAALQSAVNSAGWSDQIRIHQFTTRSHAKLLISDDGRGRWSAIVGSCNWLSSEFDSFEASVKLRDPAFVGQLVRHLSAMSLGPPGVWHDFATDLTVLGRRIETMPQGTGRTAKMRILLAPDHSSLVLAARDEAKERIFVTSHRIGLAGRPMVIIPVVAAVKESKIDVRLYYGRPTGVLSGVDAAGLTMELAKQGIGIKPIHQPRLHAKLLAWDNDNLAITSQNWLSADPSEIARRSEIGVFVESNRIADFVIRRFDHARS
jgi:phosphatidylserine/phosphatidylglycerophosphate/cardiolipin synthase-like enzyme